MKSMGTHVVTPETEESCHYFFGASGNFAIDDPAADTVFRAWQSQALLREDKPIVEAVQSTGLVAKRWELRHTMLACDKAAVRVSREIDRLEREERSSVPTDAPISRRMMSAV